MEEKDEECCERTELWSCTVYNLLYKKKFGQWKPDQSPAFRYLRLIIHNVTLKDSLTWCKEQNRNAGSNVIIIWKIAICASDDASLVGGITDSICQYGAITVKQVEVVYATTYQSPWWWVPSPNTWLSWVSTGTTKDMCPQTSQYQYSWSTALSSEA